MSRNLNSKVIRVLVADDEPEIRLVLEQLLSDLRVSFGGKPMDIQVTLAGNGREALTQIENDWFDACLTDIRMPVMTGLELLSNVRGLGKEIPVIFLTAFGDKEFAARALRLGCFDFLNKPFDPHLLRTVVSRAVEIGYHGRALERELETKLARFVGEPPDRYNQLRMVFRSMLIAGQHRPDIVVRDANDAISGIGDLLLVPGKKKSA